VLYSRCCLTSLRGFSGGIRPFEAVALNFSTLSNSTLGKKQLQEFRKNGFLIINNVIPLELVNKIKAKYDGLFAGKFETGIYPDEWHWREGLSLPDVTREICNAWKSDRLIASLVLSSGLGRMCSQLGNWTSGARIGQDAIWYKPPGAKEIAFHQDSPYISAQFHPEGDNSITCWISLDDVSAQTGTLEYAPGSHVWRKKIPKKSIKEEKIEKIDVKDNEKIDEKN